MIMGRGCVYRCAFCAYNALSAVRFYSAEYLVDQIDYMARAFGINAIYFTDSTIGNNRNRFTTTDFSRYLDRKIIASAP